jgi:predicted transcriptional regulator
MEVEASPMLRTQIQLTPEQAAELKALAAERSTSVADLIRQAVNHLLRESLVVSREERQQRALAAAGRFHSGCTDLALEHDRYLAEAYQGK